MKDRSILRRVHQHTLADILFRSQQRYPNKLAVVFGPRRLTYRAWSEEVVGVANGLLNAGFTSGDHIAIDGRNSLNYATLLYALALAGMVAVPINFMLGADEVAYILDNGDVAGVFGDAFRTEVIDQAIRLQRPQSRTALLSRRYLLHAPGDENDEGWRQLSPSQDWNRGVFAPVADSSLAQILYTSGTESRPKGVMLTHYNLLSEYASVIVDGGFSVDDVVLHALPFYHSAQQHVFLGPYTYLGATHVIIDRPTPETILPMIEQEHITEFFAPPTVWINLLRSPLFDQYDLSSLTKGHYGAAIMPGEVIRELSKRLPQTRLWNFYGQTEVAPLATVLGPEDQLRKLGSAGRASLNVETTILDDSGNPVPAGVVGEICHRTPHAMVGYYRNVEKTEEAFIGEWFHSGDLGLMDDDGYLTVIDRKKDMIKTGGENVSSREVEEVIYQMPDVAEVAVVGVPDKYWMEKVMAVVVPRESPQSLTEEAILLFCRDRLAPFKCPKQVVLVSELPKNPSGKILKRQLREQFGPRQK